MVASIHAALDRLEATRPSAVSRSEAPNAEPDPLIREEQGEQGAIVYSMKSQGSKFSVALTAREGRGSFTALIHQVPPIVTAGSDGFIQGAQWCTCSVYA